MFISSTKPKRSSAEMTTDVGREQATESPMHFVVVVVVVVCRLLVIEGNEHFCLLFICRGMNCSETKLHMRTTVAAVAYGKWEVIFFFGAIFVFHMAVSKRPGEHLQFFFHRNSGSFLHGFVRSFFHLLLQV